MPDTRRELTALQALLADNTAGDISAQDARDFLISVASEKAVQRGANASFPAGPVTGDLYQSEQHLWRYNGAAWVPHGPCYQFTDPTLQTFAWINQGGASIDTTYGGIYLEAPTNAGDSLRIRKKAIPAAPYKITAAFTVAHDVATGTGYMMSGLCWRQSSDGKVVTMGQLEYNAASVMVQEANKWTSATAFSASYYSKGGPGARGPVRWMRVEDDNTNRKMSVSADGQHWILVHSVLRTDFMTADEVGFFVNPTGSMVGGMMLHSWAES